MEFLRNTPRFSFLYDGKPLADWEKAVEVTESGDTLTTVYRLPDGLTVTNVARRLAGFDAYEWVTWFEHTGAAPSGILSEIRDADLELPCTRREAPTKWRTGYLPAPEEALWLEAPIGSLIRSDEFGCRMNEMNAGSYVHELDAGETQRFATSGGRSSEQAAPFFHLYENGRGTFFAIGWTGQWNCSVSRPCGAAAVRVCTGLEDTHFRLLPGEKIRTSSFVLLRYTGDAVEGHNRWRRLVRAHFSPIGAPEQVPFSLSLWGGMPTEGVLERLELVQQYQLPVEYIWLDAGWYGVSEQDSTNAFEGNWGEETGDWRVNLHRHPDGLRQVSRAVHEAGKKLLLWFEPERVRRKTPIAREHPEYFLKLSEDCVDWLLDLGNEQAWQWCFAQLSERIEELQIDGYRQDFNMSPLPFWRENDAPDRRGLHEIRHIMGLYRLWDALLERFPHLLIDNCASGGRRIDMEMLRRSVPLWRSDMYCLENYPPETAQTHSCFFGAWMPYSGSGTGRELDGDVYRFRSAYAPGIAVRFLRNALSSPPELLDWFRRYGEEYLRVRPYLSGDLYPLTTPNDDPCGWNGVQYHCPEQQSGIVQVFAHERTPFTAAQFPLRGLEPERQYVFTDADDAAAVVLDGKTLLEQGLPVTVDVPRTAKLWFYRVRE